MSSCFHSILFDEEDAATAAAGRTAPEFFRDLNLDQIIASVTAGRSEYNLEEFFCAPLNRVEAVIYRHEILRDLEEAALLGQIGSFARKMQTMRDHLARATNRRHYKYEQQRWFLDAVDVYSDAVACLTRDLTAAALRSRGFVALREFLTSYTAAAHCTSLLAETEKLKADLANVRYCLRIADSRIRVSRYDSEADYGADVARTFDKFEQGPAKEYRFEFSFAREMNHVEAAVLDRVACLYPDVFSSLQQYCDRHQHYLDETIETFDREIQFYVACREHVERFASTGLHFCYPTVSNQSKEVRGLEAFDLALADRLVRENTPVVTNDFHLEGPERIFIVSGPNQGGKTTFARTFGQLHYLASIGFPAPGREASLFLCDGLFTHFEKEEDVRDLRSKLEDDLLRIHEILERATPDSIVIMNESFVSTSLNDAVFLSKRVMETIIERGLLCVSVTFLTELASLSQSTVSMVSTLDPDDTARRTFKIVRMPADGLAHAAAIAEKHRVTYEMIKERVGS